MKAGTRFLVALLLIAVAARADEIRLKDGSKIIGTIVGFEDDSFKVQTAYGFALVRKDQVAEIIPSAPKQPPAPKPKDSAAAGKDADDAVKPGDSTSTAPPAITSTPTPATPDATATAAKPSARATSKTAHHAVAPTAPTPAPTPAVSAVTNSAPVSAPAANAPSAAPAAEAKPEPIREEIVGNLYINRTYGFDIYKPPDWELLPDEMHSLPNAVAAMGSDDGATLLLIGREPRKGTLEAQAATTDAQLHDIYDNIRLLSTSHANVAGEDAVERHFRGAAADRDWSVTVVTIAHGSDLFTVLGMTYADSDLIQIQENVIARVISSLRFQTQ